jgi:hypothetical protein
MRNDQFVRLTALSEKLTEVVLTEADPARWPGDGVELKDLTREDRGDRYWCKKNAAATLSLLTRVHVLANIVTRAEAQGAGLSDPHEDDEGDLDKMITEAERRAAAILEKATGRAN